MEILGISMGNNIILILVALALMLIAILLLVDVFKMFRRKRKLGYVKKRVRFGWVKIGFLRRFFKKFKKEEVVLEGKVGEEIKTHPKLVKVLIFFAFAIPLAFLLYAFYINYLPFGYSQNYELTIDNEGIISPISNEVYITNSNGKRLLSLPEGVNGQINVVVDSKIVIKDALVNISVNGDEEVYLGSSLKMNLSEINWNYEWRFSEGVPEELEGTAEYNEELECTYFDAVKEQTLSLPNSEDNFESGPMSIYIKWKPSETSKVLGNYQRLVGHYNWEIYQGAEDIKFQIGRMNNKTGSFYKINYPIDENWFETEHELLAVYGPDLLGNKGYIELFVDEQFEGRIGLGENVIYPDYNNNKNLGFGWSPHSYGKNPSFDGCIYDVKIVDEKIEEEKYSDSFDFDSFPLIIPILGNGNLSSIKIGISQ
jgi:hypothetical protein